MTKMRNILDYTKSELADSITKIGLEKFRAKQLWNWLYVQGVTDFEAMTNIKKEYREKLAENFEIKRPDIDKELKASDGVIKWLVKFSDGNLVEVVYIPEENRGTLCISSQVGCTLACKFCHTGTQTLVRNLEAHEIVAQVMLAKDHLNDFNKKAKNEKALLTNIVFMGMGEPFFNYENVKKAAEIMTDVDGMDLAHKRITVSTSGLVPEIIKSATEMKTGLALSLHATNDKLRTEIMAINKKYPLDEVMKACKFYNNENKAQKITFEYVMLNGVNDREEHAFELIDLIKKYNLNVKVNLIPFNPWESCDFVNSGEEKILEFQEILKNEGVVAPIRKTRGMDAMAACGQLKSDSIRVKKNRR